MPALRERALESPMAKMATHKILPWARAQSPYIQALIGYVTGTHLVDPPVVRLYSDEEGNVFVDVPSGTPMEGYTSVQTIPYGTLASMNMWLESVGRGARLTTGEYEAFRAMTEQMTEIPQAMIERMAKTLPPPTTTTEGAPITRGQQAPTIEDLLGTTTIDELVDMAGVTGEWRLFLDLAESYPHNWMFDETKYQHGQFQVRSFRDWKGKEIPELRILKHAAIAPGEPDPASVLYSGSPGPKEGSPTPMIVAEFEDAAGNLYIWFYELYLASEFDVAISFDEDYVRNLQAEVPDKKRQEKIVLEYSCGYADPTNFNEDDFGYIGHWLIAFMLDGSTHLYRPGPELVLEDASQKEMSCEDVLKSVVAFNGLEYDANVTRFNDDMGYFRGEASHVYKNPRGYGLVHRTVSAYPALPLISGQKGRKKARSKNRRACANRITGTKPAWPEDQEGPSPSFLSGAWPESLLADIQRWPGWQPIMLIHDSPVSGPEFTGTESPAAWCYGLVIFPVQMLDGKNVGYRVMNLATGDWMHNELFRNFDLAAKYANAILEEYPCFFQQSEEEQAYDERHRMVTERKGFPKVRGDDVWPFHQFPDIRGFREMTEGQSLTKMQGGPAWWKKLASYATKILVEKYGKDWRKKVHVRVVYPETKTAKKPKGKTGPTPVQGAIAGLAPEYAETIRREEASGPEPLAGGEAAAVPEEGGVPLSETSAATANPSTIAYVYPMGRAPFGPFVGKDALRQAETAAVLYLQYTLDVEMVEIRVRQAQGEFPVQVMFREAPGMPVF